MRGVFSGLYTESFRKRRPIGLENEAVGGFLTRHFNKKLADNLASAVLHGIYARDVDKLSAKSLFPGLWRNEAVYGSLARGMFRRQQEELLDDQTVKTELCKDNMDIYKSRDASAYTFKKGIETLSLALAKELEMNPNVTIKTGYNVTPQVTPDQSEPLANPNTWIIHPTAITYYSALISTLSAPVFASLLHPTTQSPSLAATPAVTVLAVDLHFKTPNLLPVKGSGYLIPKSVPRAPNPKHALGVIFDSDTTTNAPHPSETSTKVTVTMGGHYWTDRKDYPGEEEAVQMATEVLKRHLGITEKPLPSNVALQKERIPQYHVGHDEKLRITHGDLVRALGGRASVARSIFEGVGLNDCIGGARDVAKKVAVGGKVVTGLGGWVGERRWVKKAGPR